MDRYKNNGQTPGLHRWFTDFDGWVTDFRDLCGHRCSASKIGSNGNRLILQDAFVDGFGFNNKETFRKFDTHRHFLIEHNHINDNIKHNPPDCGSWVTMKDSQEWFIEAPWGKIAVISHGNSQSSKVLLIHGREDSSATFLPLLQLLPEGHYVALDLPGHGLSDPLRVGLTLARIQFVGAVDFVLRHLKWDRFTVIAHSMGCELALFYNIAYPGRIHKLILLDAGPSLQRLQVRDPAEYYRSCYENYYRNYDKYNRDERIYSKKKAVEAVMRARGLNEGQAEIVLSRNLKKIGEDQYKLSWDRRLRVAAPLNYPVDYYCQLFTDNCPSTLLLQASEESGCEEGKASVAHLLSQMQKTTNLQIIQVEGNHDIHLIHPERVAKYISEFMKETNCKL